MVKLNLKSKYDENKVCNNPDKGWYIHYYDNGVNNYGNCIATGDFLEDFPLLDHIYLRLPWSYLEPREGVYDWDIIDRVIDQWVGHGYKIAFRITCKETNLQYATPQWVEDAGAKGEMIKGFFEPDYGNQIFLNKLENFHCAFAARYDHRPEVIYVDIGSYGDWGEGHCCCGSMKDWPASVIMQHIDIHTKHYKQTQLAISDDIIGSRVTSEGKDDIMRHIINNNITIRDDGVSVKWFAERFGYNTLRSGEIFDKVWRKHPAILELEHYHQTLKENTWDDGWPFLAAVQESHATYAGFHGDPRKWLKENPEMARILGNQLGYWFFINAVEIADTINADTFEVKCYWENKGAAKAYKSYKLMFKLSNIDGEYTSPADTFNSVEMMPHTITVRTYQLNFSAKPGPYKLSVRMYNDDNRTIELGFADKYRDDEGFYEICNLNGK